MPDSTVIRIENTALVKGTECLFNPKLFGLEEELSIPNILYESIEWNLDLTKN